MPSERKAHPERAMGVSSDAAAGSALAYEAFRKYAVNLTCNTFADVGAAAHIVSCIFFYDFQSGIGHGG